MKPLEKVRPTGESIPKISKPLSPSGCKPDVHPQQKTFEFADITLDSCFDSGNMSLATRVGENHYDLWIATDCCETPKEIDYRTWFYFRATNMKKFVNYTFTIKNLNFQLKLFNEGMVPVYKNNSTSSKWKRIDERTVDIQKYDKGVEYTFKHCFNANDHEVYFAFTFPWSYSEDQAMLDSYQQEYQSDPDIYFHRELLTYSREQRRIELLTITSHSNKLEKREQIIPGLFPQAEENPRPFMFERKKYVFISSRVHPGEAPASHVFNGLIKFLLTRDDPRAKAFRDNFVMVLVPMLNPDGVYRGHYRNDTDGLNLNRYYINPTLAEHPSIYAVKQIVLELNNSKRLFLYCDLHAHATKRGCFVYGNNFEFRQQVESMLFPKLLSLNSQYFDFEACDFSEKNVNIKDKGDGKDKEGAGRVALYKATNLVRCYTLECNYNSGKEKNIISGMSRIGDDDSEEEAKIAQGAEGLESLTNHKLEMQGSYTIENFEEIGEGIGPTLLDMISANPMSRLKTSVYRSLKNVKLHLALRLMKDPPFKFDIYLRKVNKNIHQNLDTLFRYIEDNVKVPEVMKDQTSEARSISKSKTVPNQSKRTTFRQEKEESKMQEPKKVKVVNIVVSFQDAKAETRIARNLRPQPKVIIKSKKPSVTPAPRRFGSNGGARNLEPL